MAPPCCASSTLPDLSASPEPSLASLNVEILGPPPEVQVGLDTFTSPVTCLGSPEGQSKGKGLGMQGSQGSS